MCVCGRKLKVEQKSAVLGLLHGQLVDHKVLS